MNNDINEEELYQYCQNRWDYYQSIDGGHYPSKHDKKVFADVSEKYNISAEEAMEIFSKMDKIHVSNQHIENMSKEQMAKMFDSIVKNNAETPWGAQEIRKRNINS